MRARELIYHLEVMLQMAEQTPGVDDQTLRLGPEVSIDIFNLPGLGEVYGGIPAEVNYSAEENKIIVEVTAP